jgi:hypothetical protein
MGQQVVLPKPYQIEIKPEEKSKGGKRQDMHVEHAAKPSKKKKSSSVSFSVPA